MRTPRRPRPLGSSLRRLSTPRVLSRDLPAERFAALRRNWLTDFADRAMVAFAGAFGLFIVITILGLSCSLLGLNLPGVILLGSLLGALLPRVLDRHGRALMHLHDGKLRGRTVLLAPAGKSVITKLDALIETARLDARVLPVLGAELLTSLLTTRRDLLPALRELRTIEEAGVSYSELAARYDVARGVLAELSRAADELHALARTELELSRISPRFEAPDAALDAALTRARAQRRERSAASEIAREVRLELKELEELAREPLRDAAPSTPFSTPRASRSAEEA